MLFNGTSGTLTITSNGIYDISGYDKVVISIPSTSHVISGSSGHSGNEFHARVYIDGVEVWHTTNNNSSSFSKTVD